MPSNFAPTHHAEKNRLLKTNLDRNIVASDAPTNV